MSLLPSVMVFKKDLEGEGRAEGGYVLRDNAILDLESHDGSDEIGKTRHEEEAFVGNYRRAVVVHFLPLRGRKREENKHEEEREDCGYDGTRSFGGHGETLTLTFVIGFFDDTLDHESVHHELRSAFRRRENDSHHYSTCIASGEQAVETKRNGHTDRVEHKVGNTTMMKHGKRIRNVTKHKLVMKKERYSHLKTPRQIGNRIIFIHLLVCATLFINNRPDARYNVAREHQRYRTPWQTLTNLDEKIQQKDPWLDRACPKHIDGVLD